MNWKALIKAVLTLAIPTGIIYSFNIAPEPIRDFLTNGLLYALLGVAIAALLLVLYCLYDETLDDEDF